jgi:hypothetical protein
MESGSTLDSVPQTFGNTNGSNSQSDVEVYALSEQLSRVVQLNVDNNSKKQKGRPKGIVMSTACN